MNKAQLATIGIMRQNEQSLTLVHIVESEQAGIEVNRVQFPIVIGVCHIGLPAIIRYSQAKFVHDSYSSLLKKHAKSKNVLFPLDGCWWFRRNVVAHAVHTFNVVYDVVTYLCHEVVRKVCPVGSHCIGGSNST